MPISYPLPKYCYTASGLLYVQAKVLLVFHKKMQSWMGPGGHIEEGETPEEAAQREFFEETNLRVEPVDTQQVVREFSDESKDHIAPIAINSHWVSHENFSARKAALAAGKVFTPSQQWAKGCEKHFNFCYLMRLAEGETANNFHEDEKETAGIQFFDRKEVESLAADQLIFANVLEELRLGFQLAEAAQL